MVDEKNSSNTPEDDASTLSSHGGITNPQRIGNYKIIRKIGEGGMGIVYEAEQEKPFRRKAALKLIKWGMDTKEVIARFESERQAIALMNHPNIARVYDAGATKEGRPYFVMEHAPGIPITEYCDRHRLTTQERLNIFMQVCDAVQHAHQKGIIHRDIKPSNILVMIQDGKPIPKIIDFGVAKATQIRLTEKTVFTEYGQIIGTPEYMSPEQADVTALDIDTRTDIYSLGVILYELLAGALPFDPKTLRKAGYDEIRRKIREEEPPRPSTRLSTLGEDSTLIAKNRRTDPMTLIKLLRGDLDWITMKALEKDRTRRYASASELDNELLRYKNHEPVSAGPPGKFYRMKKFVQRHRLGVSAGILILASIIVGSTLATIGFVSAKRAEVKATQEAETSKQVSEFLVNLFEVSDPSEARGNTITAREILDKGAEEIEQQLKDQPLIQSRLMSTMGRVYRRLGLYRQAEPFIDKSLKIREKLLGKSHPDTLESMYDLASVYRNQQFYKKAEKLQKETLEISRRVLGEDHPDTLKSMNNLANDYFNRDHYKKAEELQKETLEISRRVLGNDHPDTLNSMNSLAVYYNTQESYKEAEILHKETLKIRRRVLGNDHPSTLSSMKNLASVYKNQSRFEEAEKLHKETLEIRRRVLGEDHPSTLNSMISLSIVYRMQHYYKEAENLCKEALEIQKRTLGEDHPLTLDFMSDLAIVYKDQGRYEEAEKLCKEALEIQKRTLGEDHPNTLYSMRFLASSYYWQNRYQEAEKLYKKVLEIQKRTLGEDHPDTLDSMSNLAHVYKWQSLHKKAEKLFKETFEISRRVLGNNHPDTIACMSDLARCYSFQGRYEEAEKLHKETIENRKRVLGNDHINTLASMNRLVILLISQDRYEEAERLCKEALEIKKRTLGEYHPLTLDSMSFLAAVYKNQSRFEEAEKLFKEILEIRKRTLGEEHRKTIYQRLDLAIFYRSQNRYKEAETLLIEALNAQKRILGEDHEDTIDSMEILANLYKDMGRLKKSRKIFAEWLSIMKKVAEQQKDNALAKNAYAWGLLTCEITDLQNPNIALKFALEANELTNYESPDYLDTLALAYHLTGQREKAIENAKKALSLTPKGHRDYEYFREQLAKFEASTNDTPK